MAVEFRCERGYADSGIIGMPQEGMLELLLFQNGSGEMESFDTRAGWTDDENNSFWD